MSDGSVRIDVSLETKNFVKDINNMSSTAKTGLQKLDDSIASSVSKLEQLEKKQQELTKQISIAKQAILEQSSALEKAKAKYDENVSSLTKLEQKLEDSKKTMAAQKQILAENSAKTDELRIRYETLKETLGKNADATIQAKEAYEQSKQVVNENKQAVQYLEAEYKTLNEEYKQNLSAVKQAESENKKLETEYNQQGKALDALEKELIQTNGAIKQQEEHLLRATSSWVTFKTKMSDVSKDMKKVSDDLQSIGKSVTDIGTKLSIGITAPLTLLGKNILDVGMEFEASLSGIKAVTGATVKEMDSLRIAAMDAGEKTKYSASESANAIEELAKAGLTTAQILEGGLDGALVLAAAGEISVADAAEVAATALNAFKDDALSVGEAADILAGAANASATDVAGLRMGLSQASAVASGMGLSFMDTSTALAVFAQNGLKGSDAGTSLKTMLMNLQPVTDKQIGQFMELGLLTEEGTSRFYDMNGELRPLSEIAGLLNVSLKDLTDAERAMALEVMFGSDAIRAGNILFKEGADGVTNMADAMLKVSAADVAAERMNNLKGEVEETSGKFETLKIKLFDTEKGALSALVKKVSDLISWMLKLDGSTLQTIATIGLVAAAIGPIVIIIGQLITAMGTIFGLGAMVAEALAIAGTAAVGSSVGVNLLAGAFTFLSSSAFLVPAAIVAITVAIAELTPVGDSAYAVLVALVAGFVAFKTVAFVQAVIAGVTAAFTAQTLATSASTASTIAYTVATKAMGAAQAIAGAAVAAFNVIMGLLNGSITIVTLAQWLWNAAMLANPIGLIIAGVAALAAGIAFLVVMFNKQSEATKKTVEETNKLIDKQKELTDSIGQANVTYDENFKKLEAQNQITKSLADGITGMTSAELAAAASSGELYAQIEALNKAVPDLNLAYDENTNSLNLSNEAIMQQVAAQEAQLELNAQLAEQQRLKEDEIRIETELAAAQQARLDIEKTLAESTNLSRGDKKALQEQVEKLTESETAYSNTLADISAKQEILNPQIAENAKVVQDAKQANLEAETAMKQSEEALKAQEEAAKKAGEAYEKYADMTTNALKKIRVEEQLNEDGTKKTQEQIRAELKETMETNTQIVDEWTSNLQKLEGLGLDPKFVDDLRQAGPESAEIVAALVTASDTEIKELNKVFENGSKTAIEAMKREMGLPATVNSGKDMIDDVAESAKNNKALENAAVQQVVQAKTAMTNQVQSSNFKSVGTDMDNGVAVGIDNGTSVVTSAARRLINAALAAMREAADSHSPSEETKDIAHDMGDGVIVGSHDKEAEVGKAGGELASSYIAGLSEEFSAKLWDASAIMLGEWTDVHQGMAEIVKMSGAEVLQAEIDNLDKIIAETEKKNAEIAKAEAVAAKERAVAEAKSGEDRVKAQKELNKLLADNELEALKERRDNLKEQLQEISDAYNEMSNAIVTALKAQYTEQRDLAKEALNDEYDNQKEALDNMVEARKEALDAQIEAQKEATDAIIEQYKAEYDARIASLDWSENSEIGALQAQIDSLDAQTEAEERALKEQANQKKLFDLEQKIQQATTEEDRISAQEKYNEEVAKQQRDALLLQRKDEKASLKEQINQIKQSYKEQRDAAKEEFDAKKAAALEEEKHQLDHLKTMKDQVDTDYKARKAALDEHLKSESSKIDEHYKSLTQKERLEAEARKLMIDGNQQEIVNLLNKYVPDWATAGQSAGQAFLNALQGVTPSIESEVQRIMGLISQASQAQSDLANIESSVSQPQTSSSSASTQQTSKPQQTYTVKAGDTLSGIASKYGVSVTALRNENGLDPADDKKLQIGKTLRIPILHEGGISLKEQFALIDKQEAVAPLADLYGMMERAVIATANRLVSGFSNTIKNVTNTVTHNNDNGITLNVDYHGEMERNDVFAASRFLADQTAREMRSRGIAVVGGGG